MCETEEWVESKHIARSKSKQQVSIYEELCDKYSIPPNLAQKANYIYCNSRIKERIHRKNNRMAMLFYCVYCAAKELDMPIEPVQLGACFNLKPTDINRCLSMYSPLSTGYTPPQKLVQPTHYIRTYGLQLNLQPDIITSIEELSTRLINKYDKLKEDNPVTLAAGLLIYGITIYGVNIDMKEIVKITNKTETTLEKLSTRIAELDNA
jgi:transcription initiation factor TFIIIB Brf1 subunit/transcription initiation factor TFIIB